MMNLPCAKDMKMKDIKKNIRSLFGRFFDFLYPPACVGCGVLLDDVGAFCPECLSEYEQEKQRNCPHCFRVLQACDCPTAEMRKRGAKHLYKVFPYHPTNREKKTNQLIYALKDMHLYHASKFVADEMYMSLLLGDVRLSDYVLTYIPASKTRMVKRGYNQMKMVAKCLGELGGCPIEAPLYRTREGTPQKSLPTSKRFENTKGIFSVKKSSSVAGKKYIIIDDIATSGATLMAAAATLREAGADHVIFATAALTIRTHI